MPTFAVDHDFPEPILITVEPYLPFKVKMLRHISPALVRDKDDWEVLLAISQRHYDGLITLDYEMLKLPREMAIVHQTNLTLIAIEAAGDNPLVAIGQLLVQAKSISNAFDPNQPQVFRISRSRATRPVAARALLGEMASRIGVSIQQLLNENRL
jgi:hypothetical protein